jgi:tetratricopeptide (TPR) repeat protein
MFSSWRIFLALALVLPFHSAAQEDHNHPEPEKLGTVSFSISCKPGTQQEFNRGVALLHSFAYAVAEKAFREVAERDPQCAIAHWGIAMTHFHQLWDPARSFSNISLDQEEIRRTQEIKAVSKRERTFIDALALLYQNAPSVPYRARATNYELAMKSLAAEYPNDAEAQVFYALALLSNASPSDKTHVKQKQAADILEPLYRTFPQHPGIPHYLIHAYDNAELAPKGLAAARAYSKIAPSAPHALHMPSHIFTRLGLWDESIASNTAAKNAAHHEGDVGEELHAMDYLVYAYLQSGRDNEANRLIQQMQSMHNLNGSDFKIEYAATAMPIRYAVERRQWKDAVNIVPPPQGALPQVVATTVWARGLGLARTGNALEAHGEIDRLGQIEEHLHAADNEYWATQVKIMKFELMAWSSQAENKPEEALALLRNAADAEDAVEKLPVTPGPIVPAREQLGFLLLEQKNPDAASNEFRMVLTTSPGRRGSLQGAAQASNHPGQTAASSDRY